ncbi:MAG: hypothetical protein JWN72_1389 [Thermoleophilia bacterium]|nr:hypothetical protein [Thermoleophilia bacterium]
MHAPLATGGDRIQRILASVPAGVAVLRGPSHVFEAHNAIYAELVGADRELVGLTVAEALPEVVEQGFVALLDGVYRTGEPFVGSEVEIVLERSGASMTVFVDFAYIATRDDHGTVNGIIAHVVDVTKFVRARDEAASLAEQLQVERARLHEVIEQLDAGVAIGDAEGRIVLANQAWRASFDMPAEEVARIDGIDDYTVFRGWRPDGTAYEVEEFPISRALLHGEHVQSERIRFRLANGEVRTIDVSAMRIATREQDAVAALVTTIDMTQHLALEQELRDERHRQVESDRRRAYEMNDTVVQRLAVADLAFGLGRTEEAAAAVRDALTVAKRLIGEWGRASHDLALAREAGEA